MARNYRNYTDEDIIRESKSVESVSELCRNLGLKPLGGNLNNMKRNLQRLNVDTKHFTGQGWTKDKQLKDYSQYTKARSIKPHLIKERGHKCEMCELEEWMDAPIPLELHHIDGNSCYNEKENLQLLCCNCHSLTDTWKGRNINNAPVC